MIALLASTYHNELVNKSCRRGHWTCRKIPTFVFGAVDSADTPLLQNSLTHTNQYFDTHKSQEFTFQANYTSINSFDIEYLTSATIGQLGCRVFPVWCEVSYVALSLRFRI